jgi:hypothetical protein
MPSPSDHSEEFFVACDSLGVAHHRMNQKRDKMDVMRGDTPMQEKIEKVGPSLGGVGSMVKRPHQPNRSKAAASRQPLLHSFT